MNKPQSAAERYAYEQCLTAASLAQEERYAREAASRAFQARFDAPECPRPVSARQALHTGNWAGFFASCCTPAAPF